MAEPDDKKAVVLALEKVTVEFDGFRAVNGMDLELREGELHFLIGPNGAGKTTLLDIICGKVKPSSGTVRYRGHIDIARKKEHQIAMLGIGRKFQAPSIFAELTVADHLELAIQKKRGVFAVWGAKPNRPDRERISRQMELIGLAGKAEVKAGGLSHGEKQWLEIGMMLMQEPAVLLLDEPVAGMSDRETEKTGELLREIAKGRSVLVVEHDMEFVRRFAARVTVMHEGRLLKEGAMEDVQRDARVAEVYLGKRREADVVGSTA